MLSPLCPLYPLFPDFLDYCVFYCVSLHSIASMLGPLLHWQISASRKELVVTDLMVLAATPAI